MAPIPVTALSVALGKWLLDYRASEDLAQVDIATLMVERGIPWDQATVSKVENGKRNISMDEFIALGIVGRLSLLKLLDEISTYLED